MTNLLFSFISLRQAPKHNTPTHLTVTNPVNLLMAFFKKNNFGNFLMHATGNHLRRVTQGLSTWMQENLTFPSSLNTHYSGKDKKKIVVCISFSLFKNRLDNS